MKFSYCSTGTFSSWVYGAYSLHHRRTWRKCKVVFASVVTDSGHGLLMCIRYRLCKDDYPLPFMQRRLSATVYAKTTIPYRLCQDDYPLPFMQRWLSATVYAKTTLHYCSLPATPYCFDSRLDGPKQPWSWRWNTNHSQNTSTTRYSFQK